MDKTNWLHMYTVAEEILALAPWKTFCESDLVALQPKENGPVYFASIMGQGGEHHAIAYYVGWEGLNAFKAVTTLELPETAVLETVLFNGHFQLGFERKSDLRPAESKLLKSIGKTYRGKWPVFRSHRPARMPWMVTEQEAADLCLLMEQTLAVLKRSEEDLFRDVEEDEFFMLTWDGKDSVCRVDDLPQSRHIIQAELPGGALDGLAKLDVRLEVETVVMTTPIEDVPKGEAPYFPLVLLVVDSDMGLVVGTQLISTVDGPDAAYAQVPAALTQILKDNDMVPAILAARHPILLSLLEAYSKSYGIDYEEDQDLLAAQEAIESLLGFNPE